MIIHPDTWPGSIGTYTKKIGDHYLRGSYINLFILNREITMLFRRLSAKYTGLMARYIGKHPSHKEMLDAIAGFKIGRRELAKYRVITNGFLLALEMGYKPCVVPDYYVKDDYDVVDYREGDNIAFTRTHQMPISETELKEWYGLPITRAEARAGLPLIERAAAIVGDAVRSIAGSAAASAGLIPESTIAAQDRAAADSIAKIRIELAEAIEARQRNEEKLKEAKEKGEETEELEKELRASKKKAKKLRQREGRESLGTTPVKGEPALQDGMQEYYEEAMSKEKDKKQPRQPREDGLPEYDEAVSEPPNNPPEYDQSLEDYKENISVLTMSNSANYLKQNTRGEARLFQFDLDRKLANDVKSNSVKYPSKDDINNEFLVKAKNEFENIVRQLDRYDKKYETYVMQVVLDEKIKHASESRYDITKAFMINRVKKIANKHNVRVYDILAITPTQIRTGSKPK